MKPIMTLMATALLLGVTAAPASAQTQALGAGTVRLLTVDTQIQPARIIHDKQMTVSNKELKVIHPEKKICYTRSGRAVLCQPSNPPPVGRAGSGPCEPKPGGKPCPL